MFADIGVGVTFRGHTNADVINGTASVVAYLNAQGFANTLNEGGESMPSCFLLSQAVGPPIVLMRLGTWVCMNACVYACASAC